MSDPAPSKRVDGDAILDDVLIMELLDARLVGVFANLNRDGTIHAVPMWFAPRERSILLATSSRSAKVANVQVDSRSTLVIHDSRPGFEVCGVSLVGDAEIVRGVDARPLVRHVHGRYIEGSMDMSEAVSAFLESDDVAIRFSPRSAFTWDQRETEANVALRAAAGALPLLTTEARGEGLDQLHRSGEVTLPRTGFIDHIGIGVPDLAAAKQYYDDLMSVLGLREWFETGPEGPLNYGPDGALGSQLFFYKAEEPGAYSRLQPGFHHLAFLVASRAVVRAAHEWALARDAIILDEPREFPQYGPHCFATYWLDPHGFKLEAVCHSPEGT